MIPASLTEPPAPIPQNRHPLLNGIFNGILLCSAADWLSGAALLATDHHSVALKIFSVFCTLGVSGLSLLFLLGVSSFENTPWRPFLPLLLVYSWGSIGFLPLPVFTGLHYLVHASLALQFLALAYCVWSVRNQHGTRFLLPESAFFTSRFSWAHCLRAHVVLGLASIVMACGAVLLGVFSLEYLSAGFLRIRPSGVYTETRVYQMQEAKVFLLPSVHIATPGFYERLLQQLPTENAVIIPEGVTDQKGLLRHGIDHSVAAKSVGLTAQPPLADPQKVAVQTCDLDVSDFLPATQSVLRAAGEMIAALERHDSAAALRSFPRQLNVDLRTLQNDILDRRNARVISAVESQLEKHPNIGVPWGAAHMAGIEEAILAKGARRVGTTRVQVFAWKDLRLALP